MPEERIDKLLLKRRLKRIEEKLDKILEILAPTPPSEAKIICPRCGSTQISVSYTIGSEEPLLKCITCGLVGERKEFTGGEV